MESPSTDIHLYDDFRKLLKARYQELKSGSSKFSHRYFCRVAGYSSSSAFADILGGRRKLSPTGAMRLARALHFSKADEEYFLNLVGFNQAVSLEEKNLFYARMLTSSKTKMETISPDKYEYFSKWYHAALRELLYFHPCKDDYKSLGKLLDPPVPAVQVRKAIQLLEKLGMIARDANGVYRQTAKLITAEGAVGSMHVENFQVETMKLAKEALDRHPRDRRDISTLTATLSAESMEKVKAAVKALRQCVVTLAEQDEKVDRVYQLNIQLFPLSKF